MGCVIGSIISSVACCCCNTAAGLCCACLPSCKSSTSSRIMHLLYFTLGFILAVVMLIFNFGNWLKDIKVLCQPVDSSIYKMTINFNYNCTFTSSYGGIYRCCFGISFYFFVFSVLMIRVKSSSEIRGKINNGFWFFKFILFAALIIASLFLLPDPYFSSTWLVFGMIGGFLYILIQLVLLVDFAHIWSEKWVEKYENDDSTKHYYALIVFAIIFYSLALILISLLLFYFGSSPTCHLHRFFILFNTVLCLIATGVSVSPKIQEYTQRSGLLQASLITIYISFLTWGALISSPHEECNPFLREMMFQSEISDDRVTKSVLPVEPNGTEIHSEIKVFKLEWNYYIVVSVIVYYVFIIYFSIRNSVSDPYAGLDITQNIESTTIEMQHTDKPIEQISTTRNSTGQVIINDESDGVKYDYSLFHFIYCLGAIYLQMTLTSWFSLYSDVRILKISNAAMWVKISSSWMCIILYMWTLLAPVLFPDRDFN